MNISIIIPVYNGFSVIGECLTALRNSRLKASPEIIVVDDCSRDGSPEFVRKNFPEAILLRHERNLGYARSVNHGLDNAHGDFIMLLNQDTVADENALSILCAELERDERAALAAPALFNLDGSRQPSIRQFPRHRDIVYHHLGLPCIFPRSKHFNRWKMPELDYAQKQYVPQPAFSAVMLTRKTLSEIGILDERFRLFFNDVDYCRRVYLAGYKILYCPEAVVYHQKGQATGQNRPRSICLSHVAFIQYLWKHFRGWVSLLPNLLCSLLLLLSIGPRVCWHLIRRMLISKG